MKNKGIYRYDLNLRRGGKLRIVRCAQKIEHPDGTVIDLVREEAFVWDRGELVMASLL